MASSISNFSTRGRICVREGIRVPGGGYIFADREARFVGPKTTLEIDNRRIDPTVIQQRPGAELVVELWVEGYDNKKIVTLEPAGGTIEACNTAYCGTAVRISYVRYRPGTLKIEEKRYFTTIYADDYHRQ